MHVELALGMIVIVMLIGVLGTLRFAGMGIAVILVPLVARFLAMALFTVIVPLEGAALAELQLREPGSLAEFDHLGSCAERIKRLARNASRPGRPRTRPLPPAVPRRSKASWCRYEGRRRPRR